jgi:hypothetical protein
VLARWPELRVVRSAPSAGCRSSPNTWIAYRAPVNEPGSRSRRLSCRRVRDVHRGSGRRGSGTCSASTTHVVERSRTGRHVPG